MLLLFRTRGQPDGKMLGDIYGRRGQRSCRKQLTNTPPSTLHYTPEVLDAPRFRTRGQSGGKTLRDIYDDVGSNRAESNAQTYVDAPVLNPSSP